MTLNREILKIIDVPYLIDGHNLIPKLPGLKLEDPDDETSLLRLLLEFCRRQRKQAEVFFDNSPPDGVHARNYGLVIARFVRQGRTADQAIGLRLKRLGNEARSWIVVSSDLEVQAKAKAARARFISSEAFSKQLRQALSQDSQRGHEYDKEKIEAKLNESELEEWRRIFEEGGTNLD